jgi:GNAT superfamily N-acetyltransferase
VSHAYSIEAVSERPDLASLVAEWRVAAFFDYPGGYTVAEMTALILERRPGPRDAFVLFESGVPVGTAALIGSDLETRPDLTPWFAALFVLPSFRGRGYATALIRHVEAFATSAGVPILWLYTASAEALYARLGWERVGVEEERGDPVVLMRRNLSIERDGV